MKPAINRAAFAAITLALTGILATGCSDSPTAGDPTQANVTIQAEMTGSSVSATRLKGEDNTILSGAEVDSLHVTRVRILVSELKLHRDNDNDSVGDHTVKVGPMLITADAAGTRVVTTGGIPAGDYDKIKFEFHRFSSSEVATYLSDTNFRDFVTNDRYTFIIEGTAYKGGQPAAFTYRSDATANLSLKFDTPITLAAGSTSRIVVRIDPVLLFKRAGKILDPRDGSNESELDKAIKDAIKALKRS